MLYYVDSRVFFFLLFWMTYRLESREHPADQLIDSPFLLIFLFFPGFGELLCLVLIFRALFLGYQHRKQFPLPSIFLRGEQK
jgi:hypothetical protein